MNNLEYTSKETKDKVNAVLNSSSIRSFAKAIIRTGLDKDCIDAWKDAQLAADMLKRVLDDLLGR